MCQVVWLYSVVEIVVMTGEVTCCTAVCGTLVGVSVFSILCHCVNTYHCVNMHV